MHPLQRIVVGLLAAGLLAAAPAGFADETTKISPSLESVEVQHNGKPITITRSGAEGAHIPDAYAKTGRHCPPFCIQPMEVAPGVETVGELEVLGFLKRMSEGDANLMVVDSRTPEWIGRGTIPGAVNIPWNKINLEMAGAWDTGTEAANLSEILTTHFGAKLTNGVWDFSGAKTLVMFCNGMWCPQSSINIRTLVKLGYPANKIKWYRGGMQDWVTAGLTTVTH